MLPSIFQKKQENLSICTTKSHYQCIWRVSKKCDFQCHLRLFDSSVCDIRECRPFQIWLHHDSHMKKGKSDENTFQKKEIGLCFTSRPPRALKPSAEGPQFTAQAQTNRGRAQKNKERQRNASSLMWVDRCQWRVSHPDLCFIYCGNSEGQG